MFCILGMGAAGQSNLVARTRSVGLDRLRIPADAGTERPCGAFVRCLRRGHIAASILWLWMAEGQRPDVWDIVGGTMAVQRHGSRRRRCGAPHSIPTPRLPVASPYQNDPRQIAVHPSGRHKPLLEGHGCNPLKPRAINACCTSSTVVMVFPTSLWQDDSA